MSKPNRCILITGASRGLGLAIAERALRDGHNVVAVARNRTPGLDALIEKSDCISFFPYDLTDLKGIHDLVRKINKQFGRIYGLVNNAAVGHSGVLATMHDSQIDELLTLNLQSTILLTKYAARSMLLGGGGRIVNVSSIIAQTGFNGLSVYAATKAGLIGFTKSLARELGKAKITVNAVAPGYMSTDMTQSITDADLERIRRRSPLGRLADVSEVASAVLYLLSDDAAAITGTVLTVDAGSTS